MRLVSIACRHWWTTWSARASGIIPAGLPIFRRTLAEVDKHPNRRYFILKSIIVNNLYGVNIMEEPWKSASCGLFLELVAQVDRVKDLEPLPDIDFNIRPGNTLVGFVSVDEIRRAAESDTSGQANWYLARQKKPFDASKKRPKIVERAFQTFHKMQTTLDMDAGEFADAKQELRNRLRKLADELDRYLASEYGVDPSRTEKHPTSGVRAISHSTGLRSSTGS